MCNIVLLFLSSHTHTNMTTFTGRKHAMYIPNTLEQSCLTLSHWAADCDTLSNQSLFSFTIDDLIFESKFKRHLRTFGQNSLEAVTAFSAARGERVAVGSSLGTKASLESLRYRENSHRHRGNSHRHRRNSHRYRRNSHRYLRHVYRNHHYSFHLC